MGAGRIEGGKLKPRLQNTLIVVIKQKLPAQTLMDDNAREPIKKVKRSEALNLRAQVVRSKFFSERFQEGGQGGPTDENRGYMIFDLSELATAGVTLQRGDKITSIGGVAMSAYLSKREHFGVHQGRSTLEVWDYEDRDLTQGG